ncbi:hypothetical protein ACM23_00230 [Helicobacter pylori]|nr:hypothetical protein [Helicobacter pylori]KNE07698.1 hypothetical protein ACM23_00230 [Helicobacter pylori]
MVKERLEEAHNSPKGNFYFFLPILYFFLTLLWGSFGKLWLSFISCFFVLSCFIKISRLMYNNRFYQFVLKGQRE